MCKVRTIQNLSIDDPEYTQKKTRNGGFETTERKRIEAALAASIEAAAPHDTVPPAAGR